MMQIFFSLNKNKEILRIPYVPPGIKISDPLNTEEFETSSGKILTLIGENGLRSFSVDSFFPSKRYPWLPFLTNLAPQCVNFFKKNRKQIFRVVVLGGSVDINMLCTIREFNYSKKHNGDIDYSLEVVEYIDPSEV